jgi:hypothetical protein
LCAYNTFITWNQILGTTFQQNTAVLEGGAILLSRSEIARLADAPSATTFLNNSANGKGVTRRVQFLIIEFIIAVLFGCCAGKCSDSNINLGGALCSLFSNLLLYSGQFEYNRFVVWLFL